jgi:hypothetical protein
MCPIANGFCPFIDHCVDLGLFTQRHMSSIHFALVLKYFYSVYWTKFESVWYEKKSRPCLRGGNMRAISFEGSDDLYRHHPCRSSQ